MLFVDCLLAVSAISLVVRYIVGFTGEFSSGTLMTSLSAQTVLGRKCLWGKQTNT